MSIPSPVYPYEAPKALFLAFLGLATIGLSTAISPILALAPVALAIFVVLALRAPRFAVLAALCLLPFLGVVRRASGSYLAPIDPLTLAGPMVAIACLVTLSQGKPKFLRTPLAKAVTAMVCIGLVEILNPRQGNPIVGLAGAGLFVGPLVWFFVGQRIGDERTLARLLKILRVVAVIIALYGVKQVLFGFTGFEKAWVTAKLADYQALIIGGRIRPFSTFTSGAEYSYFLVLGAVLFTVSRGRVSAMLKAFVVIAFLLAAFYAGTRSIFVAGIAAVLIVALLQRTRSLGRALAACAALALAGVLLLSFVPLASGGSTAAKIQNRTLEGLTDPFNTDASTLGGHITEFRVGVLNGIRSPLGMGAAAVNRSGAKLGAQSASAEHDIPNVLLAYGWAGGLVLVFLLVRIYRLLKACVAHRRTDLFAPAVFVIVLFGAWFQGELYAVSALVWFFLGSIDKQLAGVGDPEAVPASAAVVTVGTSTI